MYALYCHSHVLTCVDGFLVFSDLCVPAEADLFMKQHAEVHLCIHMYTHNIALLIPSPVFMYRNNTALLVASPACVCLCVCVCVYIYTILPLSSLHLSVCIHTILPFSCPHLYYIYILSFSCPHLSVYIQYCPSHVLTCIIYIVLLVSSPVCIHTILPFSCPHLYYIYILSFSCPHLSVYIQYCPSHVLTCIIYIVLLVSSPVCIHTILPFLCPHLCVYIQYCPSHALTCVDGFLVLHMFLQHFLSFGHAVLHLRAGRLRSAGELLANRCNESSGHADCKMFA